MDNIPDNVANTLASDFIDSSRYQLIMRLQACDPSKRVRGAMSPTPYEEIHHNGKCKWNASEMAELLVRRDPVGEYFLLEMLAVSRDLFFRKLATMVEPCIMVEIPYAVQRNSDIVYEMT